MAGVHVSSPPESLQAIDWGWRHSGREAWAVKGINLSISPGSSVLLLGASGSGKSTLLQGMAGLLSEEEGESAGAFYLAGSPTSSPTARALVGMVQQDPDSQIVMEKIGDEVAFGCENMGLPRAQIWQRVSEALTLVGLDLPLDHPTKALSGGEKQRLALAASLAMRPKLLLLDEPTANLDSNGVRLVHEAVARVADQTDTSLVIVEHRVQTWLDIVDRAIVLGGGEVIADGPPEQTLASQEEVLLDAGIWVPGHRLPVLPVEQMSPSTPQAATPILDAVDLTVGHGADCPALSGVNLQFRKGESTCIVGANGVGKTTLALTLAGLLAPLKGKVIYCPNGQSPTTWPSEELLGRIAMVFQEPSYQFLTSTVQEELAFGLRGVSDIERRTRVDDFLERLRLKPLARAHPLSLSGGEKRRLSVASALIAEPEILILDEPTFGQDRNTWIGLVEILQELIANGTTVVSITHDHEFSRAIAQRIINLDEEKTAESATTAAPPSESTPLTAPAPAMRRTPIISRINPVFQLIGLALMTLPMFVTVDWLSASVALALEAALLPLAGLGPLALLRRLWPLLIAAPMAAVSMMLYAKPLGDVYFSFGPAIITQNSIELSLAISLRVLAIGIPSIVILTGARPTEMADALTQVARFPARQVFATLAGVRLSALMLQDWQALHQARRSRGGSSRSRFTNFFRGIFALFTFALRRAGTLAVTMEARGFGSPIARSYARDSRTGPADAVMPVISVGIPAVSIGTAVAMGTFRLFGT